MTSIRKREWTAPNGEPKQAWLVDYRDPAGNRRSKQFSRRKDAAAWRVETDYGVSNGTHTPDSQSITVAEAAEIWMSNAKSDNLERSTLHGYDNLSRLHIIPFLGATRLNKLTRPMVEQYRVELMETRSTALVGKAIRALSSIINYAMRQGLVAQNVARGATVAKKTGRKERVEIPTRKELKALIAACSDNELPLILTAVFTGLRASELRGLRWQDVDLVDKVLSVKQRADAWNVLGPPKSEASVRSIPLPDIATTTLKRWKLACPPSKMDLVFPCEKGTPYAYQNLLRRVYFPLQIRAGLSRPALDRKGKPKVDQDDNPVLKGKYGFHALRHAAASGWIEQNIDLKRLQTWMGHESIQITLDTYGHLIKDKEKDAAIASAAEARLFS
mgnify:FL=1